MYRLTHQDREGLDLLALGVRVVAHLVGRKTIKTILKLHDV